MPVKENNVLSSLFAITVQKFVFGVIVVSTFVIIY
jgi:hypothetical protein